MSSTKEKYFRQLYEAHKDKVFRLCVGFVGEEAEAQDVFQEVMIKIWNKLEQFRQESQISTWIYRITANTALLALNRKKRRQQQLSDLPDWEQPRPEENQEASLVKLRSIIASFNDLDRVVMTLLLESCTYQEIADITGLSPNNVGVKINRLKKKIRKNLQTHERRT